MSIIDGFLDRYDLYENPYLEILNIFKTETESQNGCICMITSTRDCIILAEENSDEKKDSLLFITDYQGSVIDKSIKTKTPVVSKKVITLPYFGKIDTYLGIPIGNREKILGLLCLSNGKYDNYLSLMKKYQGILLISRLHLENSLMEFELRKSYNDKQLKQKDLFLASMSHEIRTPLNGIIGYTQLLVQTGKTSDTQRQYIQAINKCSLNLAQIINDILDYSKLAAGKMKVNMISCKISDITEFVRDTLSPKISDKQHRFSIDISNDVSEYVTIDKQKVIQVLINLVANAVKFTDNNGEITLSVTPSGSDYLQFSVKDNGIGISREDQNKLFRTFSQLDTTLTKSYEGTGLGLAISKKLVELMKGEISLKSTLGQGSEFYFTVKYEGTEGSLKRINSIKPEKFRNKSVLVAIEDTEERISISDALLGWGMKSTPCSSSLEAKKLLDSFSYDFELCIVDLNEGLISTVKENYPSMPVIEILPSSGKIDPLTDNALVKPYNKIKLYEILDKTISESQYIKKKDSMKFKKDLNILIAEDIKYNQELLMSMLQTCGYKSITITNDGIEAIQAIQSKQFDVLLLDLRMPRLDGYQVLDYLKKNNMIKSLKIIPLTASVLEEDQNRCQSYGVNYFLRKPIDIKELKTALLS